MIIILKKDGQIVTDDGNPVEGVKLDNAAAILADPKDGDSIVYDADAGMWVAGTGGGSFEPDITNPQDGDTLVYDASEEKWVNGTGGGSGGGFLKVSTSIPTMALDKTWKQIHDAASIGLVILVMDAEEQIMVYYLSEVNVSENEYQVGFGDMYFSTDSENGYPVIST
jgi:hypothetical protein